MTGAQILGTVKKKEKKPLKGERPPESFILLLQLALPKTPLEAVFRKMNEQRKKHSRKVLFPLSPLNPFAPVPFRFRPSPLTMNFFIYYPRRIKERNLALNTRLPSRGQ